VSDSTILVILLLVVLAMGVTAWIAVPPWRQRRLVRAAIVVPALTLGPTFAIGLLVASVMTNATR
jgi:hypothetical protein